MDYNMTLQETEQIGIIIRNNRFHFRAEGVRALAEFFNMTVEGFNQDLWFFQINNYSSGNTTPS